jgi:hypothetical protein
MKAFVFLGAAIAVSALGTLLLIGKRPVQTASGGCFMNFGDGCNVYVTQTYTVTDSTTAALLVGALIVVIVLGGLFLLVTRPKAQS